MLSSMHYRHGGHTLSDIVGARVRGVRRERKINRDQLSDRCAERGGYLSAAVLLNIESGRVTGGRKRREITIDELAVLADALTVSVDDLLYDTCAQCGARILGAIEDPLKMCDTCRADYADWQAARKVEQR